MSLTLYSSLVSFVSSIIFSMKFKAWQLRKNSGFVNEVNIGEEAIFDVYDTSTSLRVSVTKKRRSTENVTSLMFLFFFFTVRVVLYAHLAHLVGCSREKHEKCRRFKVTRSPRALTIFIENNLIIIFLFHIS